TTAQCSRRNCSPLQPRGRRHGVASCRPDSRNSKQSAGLNPPPEGGEVMSATILLGLVLGLIFGASLLALGATSLGWKPTRSQLSTSMRAMPWLLTSANGKRVAIAAGVAVLAALITRWPVAAGAA